MWDTFDVCFLFVHQWLCKHISSDRTWSLFQRFIKSSLLSGQGSMAVTFTAWRCQTVTWWRVQALRLSSTEKLVKEGGPAGRGSHRRGSVAGSQNRQPMNMQAPAQPVLRKRKTTRLMWLKLKISTFARFKQQAWHLQHISPSYCLFSFISAAQVRREFLGCFFNKYLIIFPLHCHSVVKRGKGKG